MHNNPRHMQRGTVSAKEAGLQKSGDSACKCNPVGVMLGCCTAQRAVQWSLLANATGHLDETEVKHRLV